ncbi:4'-phosphopantetheinyl transferase family protein [Streptomyces sp. NPDC004779]
MLDASGSVIVRGALAHWTPAGPDRARLRAMLGRDWVRYSRLPRTWMRERFAASRLLLRYAAAAALDTAPDLVDLAYQPGGRPFVRGCDQIAISLSHTEDILVVGISREGRVGVDVERASRALAGTGAEAQGCARCELEALEGVEGEERNDVLVRLWTLKEAYSKALGQGLRLRFTEFGFALAAEGPRLVRPDGTPVDGESWRFATFADGRYVISAAVQDGGFGGGADLSVGTAFDEGLLGALFRSGPERLRP